MHGAAAIVQVRNDRGDTGGGELSKRRYLCKSGVGVPGPTRRGHLSASSGTWGYRTSVLEPHSSQVKGLELCPDSDGNPSPDLKEDSWHDLI